MIDKEFFEACVGRTVTITEKVDGSLWRHRPGVASLGMADEVFDDDPLRQVDYVIVSYGNGAQYWVPFESIASVKVEA